MRLNRAENRSNALWGRGSRGESRSNALWGRGGRRAGSIVATVTVVFAMTASAMAAGVGSTPSTGFASKIGKLKGYVPTELVDATLQNPRQSFDVIVQGDRSERSSGFINRIVGSHTGTASENVDQGDVKREFKAIVGGRMTLTGWQILALAKTGLA